MNNTPRIVISRGGYGPNKGRMDVTEQGGCPPTHACFLGSRVVDQSALQAIEAVAEKYKAAGKKLMLRHLSRDCYQLLSNAGQLILQSDEDPSYRIAVDYDVKLGRIGAH